MSFKEALKRSLDLQVAEFNCSLPAIPEILKGNVVGGLEGAVRCRLLFLKKDLSTRSEFPQGFKDGFNKVVDTVIWVGDRLQPRPPEKGPPLPYIFKLNWPGKGE